MQPFLFDLRVPIGMQKRKAIQMDGFSFLATPNGLEPSTSSVTGWRANRLHHRAIFSSEQLRL